MVHTVGTAQQLDSGEPEKFIFTFSPIFLAQVVLTMDAAVNYGYSDFLGDLDLLLAEGRTMEELEIEAFGICAWFSH